MPAAHRPNPPARASDVGFAKASLRAEIRQARRFAEPPTQREARTASALRLSLPHRVIALYSSTGDEPDTWPLIDALAAAGRTVLLPVLGRRADGTVRHGPDWAAYGGRHTLRVGFAGIAEPASGAQGPQALASATLIWCSALAASPGGDRLGTGGGWYDRALAYAASDAVVGVLLREDEVRDRVPVEAFDRPIDLIVTGRRVIETTHATE